MNGTTLFQTLYATYHDQAIAIAGQQSNQLLTAILPTVRDLIGLFVVIFGIGMVQGRIDRGEAIARMARILIVVALMSTANWGTFIVTMFTTTIPDQVSSAISGGAGANMTGAQGFDGLANAVDNFSARVHSQAIGIWYIAERVEITLAAWAAKLMIFLTFVIWVTSQASIAFFIPLGALLAPGLLFRATEEYFARWMGKLISLELVSAIALLLAAFIVQADGTMTQGIGHPAPAAQPNQNLSLNAGDLNFTGFDILGSGPLALGATPPAGTDNTLNVNISISVLWNLVLAYALGVLLLGLLTGIALFIGGTHGWTAAPAINMVVSTAQRAGSLAARGLAKGARMARA